MLSKATLKLIRSLNTRKGRRKEGLFVAEGPKLVGELLGRFDYVRVIATEAWQGGETFGKDVIIDWVSEDDLQQTPQQVIAIFRQPQEKVNPASILSCQLCIALDGVQDPGNLGTIVRLADWFGVEHLFCSAETADIWNPKAVQATMGGIARVRVHYVDLVELIRSLPTDIPIYGTSLQGERLWNIPISAHGLIVMGNEGNGVTPAVDALCSRRLFIPRYPQDRQGTESLNVAMATGIVLAEFRRRCC